MQKPALDLTKYQWKHARGDLTVYGTWWMALDSGPRPCLVIMPTDEAKWRNTNPCVVLLDQAWTWSEAIGQPERAARLSVEFAKYLGLDASNMTEPMRVRSIIVEHLDDLCRMGVMEDAMREEEVVGEAKVVERETGKVIQEGEITDRG